MVSATVAALKDLKDRESLGALISVIEGPDTGSAVVVEREKGALTPEPDWLDDAILSDANAFMDREKSSALVYGSRRVFIDTVSPSPVMVIIGAGHIAQPLSLFAKEMGFRAIVGDARASWATKERFPHVDELIVGWPDVVFDHVVTDHRLYVVLLSHDSRFETPVFDALHGKPIRYLGAMGSRRTHAMRAERLLAQGWTPDEVKAIHGPIGLDLKGTTPAETAIAILAEIIQVRYGAGTAMSLHGIDAPIHSQ